jgi:preprotein translocase subunit SecA
MNMSVINSIAKFNKWRRRLNGCTIEYDCASYRPLLHECASAWDTVRKMSDGELKSRALALKTRARSGENADALLAGSFALVKETVRRVLAIEPFDEQIFGAIVLHQGKIAEMQTGEGKTLTAVFPAVLNALGGKGVHVVTFNDYLARRDAEWMGPVYAFLGLRVGHVQERMSVIDRQKAYAADITYVTAKESGFDFLRDGLCYDAADIVHRAFHYAIVDEADSILIDEARIPLVIAGTSGEHGEKSGTALSSESSMARLVRELKQNEDFAFDTYARNIHLTENGLKRVEAMLSCANLYAQENRLMLARMHSALHAQYLLHRDRDYIVRKGGIELVDDCTGRVADKRRWPDGLQAAVEAKERCDVRQKGVILNSVTLRHFLKQYPRIAGMTATAQIADEEFREFYGLHIVVIPQHRRCIRIDHPDVIYKTKSAKQTAIVNEVVRVHATGRPVLVGTQSIQESAHFAGLLEKKALPCEVLNAKRDEFEARIIAQAGKSGAITISTNMAGRGTDIRLGGPDEDDNKRVVALGGLHVIGTNRHESQRIDNQLKGRAGRQGDPGSSRFIISLEDDLCKKYKLHELIPSRMLTDGNTEAVDNPIIRVELNRLQRIIEGQHLEIKNTLCKYSQLIEQQRKILSRKRRDILKGNGLLDFYRLRSPDRCEAIAAAADEPSLLHACRNISLAHLDRAWSHYLGEIEEIRECIHLRVYGKQDPLYEYNKCAIELFDAMLQNIDRDSISAFNRIVVSNGRIDVPEDHPKAPSATWTYLVNDNPFEDSFTQQLIGDIGFSTWAGLLWPLTALYLAAKRHRENKRQSDPGGEWG